MSGEKEEAVDLEAQVKAAREGGKLTMEDPGPDAGWRARKKYNEALRAAGIEVKRGKKAKSAATSKPAEAPKKVVKAKKGKKAGAHALAPKRRKKVVKVHTRLVRGKDRRSHRGPVPAELAPLMALKRDLADRMERVDGLIAQTRAVVREMKG